MFTDVEFESLTAGDAPAILLPVSGDIDAAIGRLRELRAHGKPILIIATETLSAPQCWRLLAEGAGDVIFWETGGRQAVAARLDRVRAIDEMERSEAVQGGVAGESAPLRAVLRRVLETARFSSSAALITGPSGAGKELMARLIHTFDGRSNKRDLVLVDCATLQPELSGSELFGHERGSFTGATEARQGAFAAADGGTLFLDEIGELPLRVQALLLRAIQEQTYKPVGGNRWQRASFRLVCATNRDLAAEAARGRFRADLYYRIAGCSFRLPPLAERREDILPLARHFVRELRGEPLEFDEPVRAFLAARDYPGNVRELRQLITRILSRHTGNGPITVGDVPEEERPTGGAPANWRGADFEEAIRRAVHSGAGLKEIGRAAEETAVRLAVTHERGNLQRAVAALGVTDRALQMRRSAHRERRSVSP